MENRLVNSDDETQYLGFLALTYLFTSGWLQVLICILQEKTQLDYFK